MSAWQTLLALGRRLRAPSGADQPLYSKASAEVGVDEEQQLDLLLKEIHVNEQQLDAQRWTTRASAFQDCCAAEAAGARDPDRRRILQRRPRIGAQALPLGGLLAAAALILAQTAFKSDANTLGSDNPPHAIPHSPLAANVPWSVAATAAPSLTRAEPLIATTRAVIDPATPPSSPKHRKSVAPPTSPSVVPSSHPAVSQIPPIVAPAANDEVATPAKGVAPTVPGKDPEDTFAVQLAALKRADKALKAGNPSAARSALAREFSPQLDLHAQALRVISACQGGSINLGRRALADQAARYPNSPYLTRMRRACGISERE